MFRVAIQDILTSDIITPILRTSLAHIRSGLLSKDDRTQEKVLASTNNGAVFGNGVYTGDNPFTFSVYGNT
jgi:hypothetical protein